MRRLSYKLDLAEERNCEYIISNGEDAYLGSENCLPIKLVKHTEIKDVHLEGSTEEEENKIYDVSSHQVLAGKTDFILTSVWVWPANSICLSFTNVKTGEIADFSVRYDENFKMEFEVPKLEGRKPDRYAITAHLVETTDHSGNVFSQYMPIVTEWHDSEKRTLKFFADPKDNWVQWAEVAEVRL